MKTVRSLVLVGLLAALFGARPVVAAGDSVTVGLVSAAVCKDATTVTFSGSSTYSNNRLDVGIYYTNDKGEYVLLRQVFTPAFGSGPFTIMVSLPYNTPMTEGKVLRLDAQMQRLSAGSYVNVGSLLAVDVTVADKNCLDKCSVALDTTDAAPANGTLTLRSHFGAWFRPEGRLQGALPVIAGRKAHLVFVGVPCNWAVRAWYYPKSGDKTPKMLPAQYWPNEFQANKLDVSNPYVTSFAKGLKPTHPLEEDDPFVTK
ncbi:MAG TPA: hypothetical protein VIK33_19340 [Anaerolineae bacterium]